MQFVWKSIVGAVGVLALIAGIYQITQNRKRSKSLVDDIVVKQPAIDFEAITNKNNQSKLKTRDSISDASQDIFVHVPQESKSIDVYPETLQMIPRADDAKVVSGPKEVDLATKSNTYPDFFSFGSDGSGYGDSTGYYPSSSDGGGYSDGGNYVGGNYGGYDYPSSPRSSGGASSQKTDTTSQPFSAPAALEQNRSNNGERVESAYQSSKSLKNYVVPKKPVGFKQSKQDGEVKKDDETKVEAPTKAEPIAQSAPVAPVTEAPIAPVASTPVSPVTTQPAQLSLDVDQLPRQSVFDMVKDRLRVVEPDIHTSEILDDDSQNDHPGLVDRLIPKERTMDAEPSQTDSNTGETPTPSSQESVSNEKSFDPNFSSVSVPEHVALLMEKSKEGLQSINPNDAENIGVDSSPVPYYSETMPIREVEFVDQEPTQTMVDVSALPNTHSFAHIASTSSNEVSSGNQAALIPLQTGAAQATVGPSLTSEQRNNLLHILGLSAGATAQIINQRVRALSLSSHPDHGGDAKIFKIIIDARDQLLNDLEQQQILQIEASKNNQNIALSPAPSAPAPAPALVESIEHPRGMSKSDREPIGEPVQEPVSMLEIVPKKTEQQEQPIAKLSQEALNKQLMSAVVNQDLNLVKNLFDQGADINTKTDIGNTPLHVAILGNNTDMVQWLLDHQADPNVQNNFGENALQKAISTKNIDENMARLLIPHMHDIDLKDNNNQTALMLIADQDLSTNTKRMNDLARLIIENQARVNMQDVVGNDAFLYAMKHKNYDLARMLFDAGANMSGNDDNRDNALMVAVRDNALDWIALILEKNPAFLMKKNNEGNNALHVVATMPKNLSQAMIDTLYPLLNDVVDVEKLISFEVPYLDVNDQGNTPLHEAIMHENIPVIKNILSHYYYDYCDELELEQNPRLKAVAKRVEGQMFNTKNRDGFTVFDLASRTKNPQIIQLIENRNKQPEIPEFRQPEAQEYINPQDIEILPPAITHFISPELQKDYLTVLKLESMPTRVEELDDAFVHDLQMMHDNNITVGADTLLQMEINARNMLMLMIEYPKIMHASKQAILDAMQKGHTLNSQVIFEIINNVIQNLSLPDSVTSDARQLAISASASLPDINQASENKVIALYNKKEFDPQTFKAILQATNHLTAHYLINQIESEIHKMNSDQQVLQQIEKMEESIQDKIKPVVARHTSIINTPLIPSDVHQSVEQNAQEAGIPIAEPEQPVSLLDRLKNIGKKIMTAPKGISDDSHLERWQDSESGVSASNTSDIDEARTLQQAGAQVRDQEYIDTLTRDLFGEPNPTSTSGSFIDSARTAIASVAETGSRASIPR